jgi:hypothetical protein
MEFGNVANARIKRRPVAFRERRLGKPHRRFTVSKHWSLGFARQSMTTTLWFKVSSTSAAYGNHVAGAPLMLSIAETLEISRDIDRVSSVGVGS